MARPRKSVSINRKHFGKEEKEARLAAEAAFRVPRDDLDDFDSLKDFGLSEAAQQEYRRIAQLAFWLDSLDRNDLINYCLCWDRARQIALSPDARREVLAMKSVDGSRKLILNPLLQAWEKCCKEMRSLSIKLGIASVDRLRLSVPKLEEAPINHWLKFLRKDG